MQNHHDNVNYSKPAAIPKKIHFIWLGGPIPRKYLMTIAKLTKIAKKSGFEVNLWVDNEMNYQKTSVKEDLNAPHLTIKKIDDLLENMEKDTFYEKKNRLNQFVYYVNREMIGFHNLAAASDLLRYEILRQEGGYYFDVDTEFSIDPQTLLVPDAPPLGIKANIRPIYSVHGNKFNFQDINGSNDIIAALPNHEVIKGCLLNAMENYQDFDRKKAFNDDISDLNLPKDATWMDLKRYPFVKKNAQSHVPTNKRTLSIRCAGPTAFCGTLIEFWNTQEALISKKTSPTEKVAALSRTLLSLSIIEEKFPKDELKIAGISVESRSDKTWLKIPKRATSFETGSLQSSLFKKPTKTTSPPQQKKKPTSKKSI